MRYTKREIAKTLAQDEAEGCCGDSLYELLLEGCEGYTNWELTDLVERFVNNGHSPECEPDGKIEVVSFERVFKVEMENGSFSQLVEVK
jgi:hypothetical protein